jgi:hypothetical protein
MIAHLIRSIKQNYFIIPIEKYREIFVNIKYKMFYIYITGVKYKNNKFTIANNFISIEGKLIGICYFNSEPIIEFL